MVAEMRESIATYSELDAHDTTIRREALAGVTTFVTMAYIIAVAPTILHAAGIPVGPSMVATIATGRVQLARDGALPEPPLRDCSLHGRERIFRLHRRARDGLSLGGSAGSGIGCSMIFTLLTVARIRQWIIDSLPPGLTHSFAAGI